MKPIPLLTCFWIFCAVFSCQDAFAQKSSDKKYTVVFYNTENLFDTYDDPLTNDGEYTPTGKCHWTRARLDKKVNMVYRAILSAADGRFPDIIGLAEIENLWVVEYLLKNTPLNEGNYGIIHKESPDLRGIDVALLYRKGRISPVDFAFIPVHGNKSNPFISRDILYFESKIKKEKISFLVNHWPSRSGGYVESISKRELAARKVRVFLDSVLVVNPKSKFLLMGDFNATPDEDCFSTVLKARLPDNKNEGTDLINLSGPWIKNGTGTIRTKGKWEIFDQFICSKDLLSGSGIRINPSKTVVCQESFLLEEDTRYLGKKPFRTYLGPIYHGGISDHLPISTEIIIP